MDIIYTYQLTIVFFLYKWLYYNNFTCVKGISLQNKYFGVYTIPPKYHLHSYPWKYFHIFVMYLFNATRL